MINPPWPAEGFGARPVVPDPVILYCGPALRTQRAAAVPPSQIHAVGQRHAVDPHVPTVSGHSWIYGFSTYVLDPSDPFTNGFTAGDIW
ncbi:proline racemase family protein [Paraburkholderia youngii]|uniref:proline racemase family protein n=1 Tax=Paraburkholderia youngii TaxID=2782701 RepID=UPI003D1C8C66